jgi:hypothetical protein
MSIGQARPHSQGIPRRGEAEKAEFRGKGLYPRPSAIRNRNKKENEYLYRIYKGYFVFLNTGLAELPEFKNGSMDGYEIT